MKRYSLYVCPYFIGMKEYKDGKYVSYEDMQRHIKDLMDDAMGYHR